MQSKRINKAKSSGGVAQVVECLPVKHDALSLNPNTANINK
jgi:hypothetical protein